MGKLIKMIGPGKRVRIHGLQAKPELNGCEGYALTFLTSKGRWEVRVDEHSDGAVAVKPTNLEVLGTAALEIPPAKEESDIRVYKTIIQGETEAEEKRFLKKSRGWASVVGVKAYTHS